MPHVKCGKLIIASDDHEIAELERLLEVGHVNGVSAAELVDAAFITAKEPNVRAIARALVARQRRARSGSAS